MDAPKQHGNGLSHRPAFWVLSGLQRRKRLLLCLKGFLENVPRSHSGSKVATLFSFCIYMIYGGGNAEMTKPLFPIYSFAFAGISNFQKLVNFSIQS